MSQKQGTGWTKEQLLYIQNANQPPKMSQFRYKSEILATEKICRML
jgi:hypothetical protein